MSRRGSSPEQLKENRERGSVKASKFFENFLNLYKGASVRDFLPTAAKINYDITKGDIPLGQEIGGLASGVNSIFGKTSKALGNATDGNETDVTDKLDPSKVPSFEDVMGMDVGGYLDKVAQVGEKAKNRDALRAGISNLAMSPLMGGQAAMEAARNVMNLTGINMAAMASQNQVLATNPTKQKIAGKYFRL